MEIADVKQHIKTGQFDKFYIFYGEEYQIIKLYLKMMANNANLELTYADSLMDLMTGIKTKSLIPVHHLYVIMDDKEYLTNEKMWEKFVGLKDDIVIFYYTSADRRLKFWKNNKDRAVEFGRLETDVLIKYIQKECPGLNDSICRRLIEACDNDYGRILSELDKVHHYSSHEAVRADYVIEKFLDDGTIYRNPKDAIFDFVSAVLERSPAKAYDLLQQSKAVGEANMALISVLYNNFKTLLQVKSGKSWKELGINGFVAKNLLPFKDNYTNGEIVHALRLLREIERGIKTGAVPDDLSVEYFLVQVI